jgi:SAM-dependent methyltransferase
MSVPEIAPGSAAHLKLVTEFYQAEPKASVFASSYRDLLAHRYNVLVPEDARVLEVGCGAGELLHRIHASSKIGVDLSPEQVARARARYPLLDVRLANGEQGPLPEGLFDVIVISDTLNYAADVEVMLRRLHGCSHRGTRLIINVYNTLWRPPGLARWPYGQAVNSGFLSSRTSSTFASLRTGRLRVSLAPLDR